MISGDFWQEPFQLKTISPNWENAPSGAGIYVVRRDSPIPRVVAEDPKGVLYVGRSKRLRNRLWQLWKANHPASGFLWGHPKLAGEIMGGICRSPKDVVDRVGELTVKVAAPIGPSELEDAERAVLYAYFYQYGELPPLNFRLPKRWNEPPSDEWIGWGNEGLTQGTSKKPMLMAGKMRLVEEVPGERGEICVFAPCRDGKTAARVKYSVTRPALSRDQEAALIDVLREILKDEGKLGV